MTGCSGKSCYVAPTLLIAGIFGVLSLNYVIGDLSISTSQYSVCVVFVYVLHR